MTYISPEGAAAIAAARAHSLTQLGRPRVGTQVRIRYRNWRREIADRTLVISGYWHGSTDWHPEPQEMFTAYEPATGKLRDFAIAGVLNWNVPAELPQVGSFA